MRKLLLAVVVGLSGCSTFWMSDTSGSSSSLTPAANKTSSLGSHTQKTLADERYAGARPSELRAGQSWESYRGNPRAKPFAESGEPRAMLSADPASYDNSSSSNLRSYPSARAKPFSGAGIVVQKSVDNSAAFPGKTGLSRVSSSPIENAEPVEARTAAKAAAVPAPLLPAKPPAVAAEKRSKEIELGENLSARSALAEAAESVHETAPGKGLNSAVSDGAAEESAAVERAESNAPTQLASATGLPPVRGPVLKTDVDESSAKFNSEGCMQAKEEAQRAASAKSEADQLFYYRRALRLCPDNPKYHLAIGRLYTAIGRNEDAQEEYKQVLKLEPSNLEAKQEMASKKQ